MNRIKRNTRRYKLINSDLLNKFVAGITDRRDKALVMLLIDTGLRAGEVIELNKDSITYRSRELSDGSGRIAGTGQLIRTKSHEERTFYFSAQTLIALTEYLTKDRGDDGLPALIWSDRVNWARSVGLFWFAFSFPEDRASSSRSSFERRLISLIFAGRNRIIMIRRELPLTVIASPVEPVA